MLAAVALTEYVLCGPLVIIKLSVFNNLLSWCILCSIMHILRIDSLLLVFLISGNETVVNRQPLVDILNLYCNGNIFLNGINYIIGLTSVSL